MKRSLLSALAILLITAAGASALPRQRRTTAAKPAPDAEFKAMIDQYYDAWSKLSTDAPAKYYAKDSDCVFFDVAPLKYKGWAEYKAGVQKNFFDNAVSAKLTPNDDLKVTRRGTVVWTSLTFHISVKNKTGPGLEMECRHTAIWEKRGGKWLIVHEHVSAPLQG
ncbi:MAG TPA: nuclear transport factor 2 family protein [Candidatus Solibacter sp.]|nr:nuclear transport factor 2 family protein [Candidatus Solibacter sp.]